MRYYSLLNFLCKEEQADDKLIFLTSILGVQTRADKIFVTKSGDVYRGTQNQIQKQIEKTLFLQVHAKYLLFCEKGFEIKDAPLDDQNIQTTTLALQDIFKSNKVPKNIITIWMYHHQKVAIAYTKQHLQQWNSMICSK